jgi:hypothetical protein
MSAMLGPCLLVSKLLMVKSVCEMLGNVFSLVEPEYTTTRFGIDTKSETRVR